MTRPLFLATGSGLPAVLPSALQLAEAVPDCEVGGEYDVSSETWSDRDYKSAGPKKHNESM